MRLLLPVALRALAAWLAIRFALLLLFGTDVLHLAAILVVAFVTPVVTATWVRRTGEAVLAENLGVSRWWAIAVAAGVVLVGEGAVGWIT